MAFLRGCGRDRRRGLLRGEPAGVQIGQQIRDILGAGLPGAVQLSPLTSAVVAALCVEIIKALGHLQAKLKEILCARLAPGGGVLAARARKILEQLDNIVAHRGDVLVQPTTQRRCTEGQVCVKISA
jgi:hypothetical protein